MLQKSSMLALHEQQGKQQMSNITTKTKITTTKTTTKITTTTTTTTGEQQQQLQQQKQQSDDIKRSENEENNIDNDSEAMDTKNERITNQIFAPTHHRLPSMTTFPNHSPPPFCTPLYPYPPTFQPPRNLTSSSPIYYHNLPH